MKINAGKGYSIEQHNNPPLSPEIPILGPKLPRRLADIPEPLDTELLPSKSNWSARNHSNLTAAVYGTTAQGREIIQRALCRTIKQSNVTNERSLEDWRKLLNHSEFTLLDRLMAGKTAEERLIARNLWRVDYRDRPPSIEEFLTRDFYLGTILHPNRNGGIWKAWFETLCQEFDRHSFLNNVVLTGALGTGKTTVMITILLYRICLLLLLKRPSEMFELGAGSPIYFALISVTREAVQQTAFPQAVNLMAASPFFRKTCGIHPGGAPSGGQLRLGAPDVNESKTSIYLISGSKGHHLIGRNLIGVGLDEGNYRLENNQDAKAFELYENMRNRVISRLKTREGYLPGITIIASSARDESSVTEQIRKEIEAGRNPQEQRVFQKAIYDVKPLPIQSRASQFKVSYGLPHEEPVLIPGIFDQDGKLVEGTDVTVRPGARTVMVPAIYREAFERNCRQALQDICGISCGGSGRLFPTMSDVDLCLKISREEAVPRSWLADEISISSEDDRQIWDFLNHGSFLTREASQIKPLRHSERMRYAHIDLATQSFAGIAVCHLADQTAVDGLIKHGQPFSELRLIVEYDFILGIAPGKVKPINFEKIQNFFLWLQKQCGFKFGLITADQYQSEMPLQMLESRGFTVGRLSVDRDKTAYRQLRTAFEEHRLRMGLNERMYNEASRLIETEKKYDHPPHGTKDVTDATAGAYLNAVNSEEAKRLAVINVVPGLHWARPDSLAPDPNGPPIVLAPHSLQTKPRQFYG